jgi:AcrR family transcriptional regulator
MTTTPDRRVRRTRRALQDALLALMTEKGYEAVTVQDIIDRADVGRSTFYTHYTYKDDLLLDCFADLRSIVEQPATTGPAGRRRLLGFSLPMFRHVHEQQRLARVVFGRPGRTPVLEQIEELLAGIVRAEIAALPAADPPSRVPQETLVRYVIGAYLSLLEWWLTADPAISPEDMDRIFQILVAPGIRAATRTTPNPHRPHDQATAGAPTPP